DQESVAYRTWCRVRVCPVSYVTVSVDSVLHSLTSLEARYLGGADLDRLTRLRVETGTSRKLVDVEGIKTIQNNRITCFQSTGNGLDDGVQSTTGSSFGKIGRCSDGINQFRLVHSKSPYISQ